MGISGPVFTPGANGGGKVAAFPLPLHPNSTYRYCGLGNCLAARLFYLRARDPHGPWLSPADDSPASPVQPMQLSADSGYAQTKAPFVLPDANGDKPILLAGTHYFDLPV